MTIQLNYSVCGTGKNIVLIHGWGTHSGIWQAITNKLALSFRVTSFDLPGYGNNQVFLENYELSDIGEKIRSIIPEQSVVLGWSMGGLIAMWLAIYYPQLVDKLILTNSSPCFIMNDDWPGIEVSVANTFKETLAKDLQRTMSRFMALQVNTENHQDARKQLLFLRKIVHTKEKYSAGILISSLHMLLHTDLRLQIARITSPVLWLLGEHDRLVPTTINQYLNIYVPQAHVKVLRNAAHIPFISHADYFLKTITKFIYD